MFLPGNSHGQRSLAGYSPWGHTELDMTEQLRMKDKLRADSLEKTLRLGKIEGKWRRGSRG